MGIPSKVPFHRQPGFPILILQAIVTAVIAVIFAISGGWVAAYSALLGGLIALLANAYFAFKAFRYFGARSARAIVQSIWAGAMGKWIITAVLFALAFVGVEPLAPMQLFIGYLLGLLAAACAPLLVKVF